MQITSSAVSLTVEDVEASASFLREHFGFAEQMTADGFASLGHESAGVNVVFLKRGIEVLPEDVRDRVATGLILAFVVADVAAEEARLKGAGVEITMPLREEPWGEKLFQVTDPNGVVLQLVEWAGQR
ncbi:VOC family protein [Kitasatospora sp. NPDC093806]|uniref:VOC family protein n=1 Tax=Kitasatospora sp. NPDC093806 TaxID=3155075 RepID=UPI0034416A06